MDKEEMTSKPVSGYHMLGSGHHAASPLEKQNHFVRWPNYDFECVFIESQAEFTWVQFLLT